MKKVNFSISMDFDFYNIIIPISSVYLDCWFDQDFKNTERNPDTYNDVAETNSRVNKVRCIVKKIKN